MYFVNDVAAAKGTKGPVGAMFFHRHLDVYGFSGEKIVRFQKLQTKIICSQVWKKKCIQMIQIIT